MVPSNGNLCKKERHTTIDFQPLNTHATRETHHTQSPFHQARSVPHGKKKTVFDAWNGYHSVPLHPDDRHLTTFITPWADTDIVQHHKATSPQETVILDDMTKSSHPYLTKPSALTTPSYGPTLWKTAFFKQQGGWMCVATMESPSTPLNSDLPETKSISQALKSLTKLSNNARSTSEPSLTSQPHKASLTFDPGSA